MRSSGMSATLELETFAKDSDCEPLEQFAPSSYLRRKRLPVRLVGIVLGVCLAPLIAMLIVAVRLTSRGPGLYWQRRVGLHGREFTIYKLRSMRQDAESLSGPVWARKGDSRITPIGGFLRWSHLDELPQIINVIRGEMCFVGPRPERPEIIDEIIEEVDGYLDRHEAMPGITGVAQVNLPPDENVYCVRRKVAADKYYIENASLWLDIRLMLATFLRIAGIRYHYGARLLGVTLPVEVLKLEASLEDNALSELESDFRPGVLPASAEETHVDLIGAETLVAPAWNRSVESAVSSSARPNAPR
ncbi:UDP-glucose:undecaprenyl-phosphate glucose-1-phosphate transferase [Planctomycetes bacterium K2D]|uniref:UDP-glucose:undecaprenyl-phosphate glucose-1-phosphate transferase n=2 Tax=Botrimarina mediterranea TaxID=2528022 RepID=A0A518KBF4_9BACT|nr:UDP-glucose:undecaprenyl-phosphate glucose-1-phosphate transferase [Botrimarina mediterranea]QDV79771.1 UDP-glucose:undecaprenyl-phosphate glucose-1-phosphate transferase [Planctomycetes bacterium K2D]